MTGEWVCRAVVGPPHGVAGAVLIRLTTDYPERVTECERLRLRHRDGSTSEHGIEWARPHKGSWLAKLEGVDGLEAAEALRGAEVVVEAAELPPLPAGEYYHHQLIGLAVFSSDGRELGRIREILRTGSNDVYITERLLVPATAEVIREVDLAAGRLVIELLPGLLESCGSTS